MGYQQILPVCAGRSQGDWAGIEGERGRRREGKEWFSTLYSMDIQSHIVGLEGICDTGSWIAFSSSHVGEH